MLTMTMAEEQTFKGAEGVELFSACWRPLGEPRAVVVLVHGIGEHSGRYPALVTRLTAAGFAVCAFDHRGHGKSPGRRGHIGSWVEYREDVRAFLAVTAKQFAGRPMFLYGHSLGALIVTEFIIAYPGKPRSKRACIGRSTNSYNRTLAATEMTKINGTSAIG